MDANENGRLDLVGLAEVAELLGVSRSTVADLRACGGERDRYPFWAPVFPEPVAELRCGPIWRRADVERYRQERRLPAEERWRRWRQANVPQPFPGAMRSPSRAEHS